MTDDKPIRYRCDERDFALPRRALLLWRGEGLCPNCLGTGIQPTTATSVKDVCSWCGGEGKVVKS